MHIDVVFSDNHNSWLHRMVFEYDAEVSVVSFSNNLLTQLKKFGKIRRIFLSHYYYQKKDRTFNVKKTKLHLVIAKNIKINLLQLAVVR